MPPEITTKEVFSCAPPSNPSVSPATKRCCGVALGCPGCVGKSKTEELGLSAPELRGLGESMK